jgi:4-amino-4-deoxy-L-arabinose transferase-like glycosyltransferase
VKNIVPIRWVILGVICILGLALRLYGLTWDQGNAIHPDERQLLFVVMQFGWPHSWGEFFSAQSPLAPHIFDQRFFAYGTFPMYLLTLLGYGLHIQSNDIVAWSYLGRVLSAIFDSGTVLLTALLALRLLDNVQPALRWGCALLAAMLVAFTPLQLQLSHFFAVDTILLFFVMLTLLSCVYIVETKRILLWSLIAGVGYGLALGTKFSAAPLAIPICVAFLLRLYRCRDWYDVFTKLCFVAGVTVLIFILVEPYALIDSSEFIQRLQSEGDIAHGVVDLPYTRQFAGTPPYIYELQNLVLWGMGLVLGVVACIAFCWFIGRALRGKLDGWFVILSWIVVYGAIICGFYVKYMRYMLPIYPLLILMAAALLTGAISGSADRLATSMPFMRVVPILRWIIVVLVLVGTIVQGLALLNVYSVPNTRVQASRWMYSHLRPGSVLTYEVWDDPLPYAVDGHDPLQFAQYTYQDSAHNTQTGLDLYSDDTEAKAQELASILSRVDVITMATDRLDKSIPRLPARYPLTIHYYQLLFQGQLGFRLAVTFENHPHLFGITLDDSNADESYSVFDHPTTRIFVRDTSYTSEELYQKLLAGVRLPT